MERIKRSQARGSSVTCNVVWYKKINWADDTVLGMRTPKFPGSEAVGGDS